MVLSHPHLMTCYLTSYLHPQLDLLDSAEHQKRSCW